MGVRTARSLGAAPEYACYNECLSAAMQSPARRGLDGNGAERWFVAARLARSAELKAIVKEACDLLDEIELGAGGKRRRYIQARMARKVEAVIADLLHALLTKHGAVIIRLAEDYYRDPETIPYRHPVVETKHFHTVLEALEKAEIVAIRRGNCNDAEVSRIASGEWLHLRLFAHVQRVSVEGTTLAGENAWPLRPVIGCAHREWSVEADLGHDGLTPTIILKAEKEMRGDGKVSPAERISFKPTERSDELAKRMRAINNKLASLDIAIEWDAGRESEHHAPWDPQDRSLYRVFTHGRTALDHHGRMYGGFWIGMPKDERWRISIDGESLVQLDLSAAFVSLLYAQRGERWPSELDPYEIAAVEQAFMARGHTEEDAKKLARKAVKVLVNARLFDDGDRRSYPKTEREEGQPDPWPRGGSAPLPVREMLEAIAKVHPVLGEYIGPDTGDKEPIGHRLFLEESEIVLSAMEACFAGGIAVLPVHDAVLVKASQYEAAAKILATAFRQRTASWSTGLASWPVIKSKHLAMARLSGGFESVKDGEGVFRSIDGMKAPVWTERQVVRPLRRNLLDDQLAKDEREQRSYDPTSCEVSTIEMVRSALLDYLDNERPEAETYLAARGTDAPLIPTQDDLALGWAYAWRELSSVCNPDETKRRTERGVSKFLDVASGTRIKAIARDLKALGWLPGDFVFDARDAALWDERLKRRRRTGEAVEVRVTATAMAKEMSD